MGDEAYGVLGGGSGAAGSGLSGSGAGSGARRVVVKIGSAVIAPGGRLDAATVRRLAEEVVALRATGARVAVVSSGAVACGLAALGLTRMPERLSDRQAAAAVGQPALMRSWVEAFEAFGVHAAQVLLTADDIDFRARFVNAHRTMSALLEAGVVPVVNENDSVSFEEIKLGDNDRLSALVAGLIGAELLVILSKAPGLCVGGAGGAVIPVVEDVGAAAVHVSKEKSATGVGGMATKLDSATIAKSMGVETVIAPGNEPGAMVRAARGERVGTRFPAGAGGTGGGGGGGAGARKRWIAHSIRPKGLLVVDEGAKRAVVERGASVLPKGVVGVSWMGVEGFGIGAGVEVRTPGGSVFARGLVSYRSDEIERIKGKGSAEIAGVLGYSYCDEVIHRDDLIVTERG